jgi:hypothetical protein
VTVLTTVPNKDQLPSTLTLELISMTIVVFYAGR